MNIIIIAIGGAIGSIMRYLSYESFAYLIRFGNFSTLKFPYPTFFINVVGSIAAGVLYYFMIRDFNDSNIILKNFLLIGFLGGFTTFSSFSLDLFRLIVAGQYSQAFVYALASVVISTTALCCGFYLSKIFFS